MSMIGDWSTIIDKNGIDRGNPGGQPAAGAGGGARRAPFPCAAAKAAGAATINYVSRLMPKPKEAPPAPSTKDCPFCLSAGR